MQESINGLTNIQQSTKASTVSLKKFNFKKGLPWALPFGLIVLWQMGSLLGIVAADVTPSAILLDALALIKNGELPRNISVSLYRATSGLLIGGTVGLFFGLLNGIFSWARQTFDTSIQMLRNIPHLSLIPLVIMTFGIGETAKISLVAVGVMFPIYINTLHGISSVDPQLVEMGKSYGLTKWQLLTKIILPGALPTILMGLRYALGVMWTTLIVSETISSSSGIGYLANSAQDYLDMTTVILCILIYALLGKISDSIARALESILLQWQGTKVGGSHE